MTKHTDYREQVKVFRAVVGKALAFESEDGMKGYLATEFADAHDLFCQFVGFCSAEFKDPAVKIKRHKLVMLMTAMVMEGLKQGRDDGYKAAKRIFSAVGAAA